MEDVYVPPDIDEDAERKRLQRLTTEQLFALRGLVLEALESRKEQYAAGLALFKGARKPKVVKAVNGGRRKPRRALNTEATAANADQD